MGLLGLITTDLCKIPHILLGGSSGSGKTMALRCILGQCIAKGADVIIADFKGGLDYGRIWHRNAVMIFYHNDLKDKLNELVDTLNEREALLGKAECLNIGGICCNGVTKKTNYLVLGNNDYCKSIKDRKSAKQKS